MSLSIGVPRESSPGEQRVSIVPDVAKKLIAKGLSFSVERGAGMGASHSDADYESAGCTLTDAAGAYSSNIVAKVQPPTEQEVASLKSGGILISFLRPLDEPSLAARLASQGVTALSMELVPRSTRAQKMDALSAMSAVAGYKAILKCADALPKFFPLLTTAAGTMRPAQVLILGAGVAGLQAIATARRLGAVVSAYDIRAAAAEEVQSLGAKFVELELETKESQDAGGYAKALAEEKQRRQVELLVPHIGKSDVVVTTALIPGRAAPLLISKDAVEAMKPGSVILDMAAPNGGNCELTKSGETVIHNGVRIFGDTNLPSSMPGHASQMYSRTVQAMILEFVEDGVFKMDFEDDIMKSVCVTHDGKVVNERVKGLL